MPGGKGINVARALKRLGEPVIAVGLAGGRAGTQITDGLDAEGIVNDFVRIDAESRTSTAVVDPTSGLSTEINEYGPEVTEAGGRGAAGQDPLPGRRRLHRRVRGQPAARKSAPSFYADIIREMNRRRIRTVVDVESEPLRLALAAEPSLVFPNQREAEALVGNEFQTDEDFQHGLSTIAAMGARGVLVTLTTGCYALLPQGKGKRRMYRAWIPRIEAVSAVGSGDAFLAGYRGRRCRRDRALRSACGRRWPAAPPTRRRWAPACSIRATCRATRRWSRCRRSVRRPRPRDRDGSRPAPVDTLPRTLNVRLISNGFLSRPARAVWRFKGGCAGWRLRSGAARRRVAPMDSTTSRSCPAGAPAMPRTWTSPGGWGRTCSSCRCWPRPWTAWCRRRRPIELGQLGGLGVLNLEGIWTRYEDADAELAADRDLREGRGHPRDAEDLRRADQARADRPPHQGDQGRAACWRPPR